MPPTLPLELEQTLARIEQQVELMFDAVHHGDPTALEAASNGLRQLGIEFSRLMDGRLELLSDTDSMRRLRKIIDSMAIQRENLMRRTASVERALDILMPEARNTATYAQAVGSQGTAYKPAGVSRQYAA